MAPKAKCSYKVHEEAVGTRREPVQVHHIKTSINIRTRYLIICWMRCTWSVMWNASTIDAFMKPANDPHISHLWTLMLTTEVKNYLSDPLLHKEKDPLCFWVAMNPNTHIWLIKLVNIWAKPATFPQATYKKISFSLDLFLQLYFKILK